MKRVIRNIAVVIAFILPLSALADPIVVVIDQGENNGTGPADGTLGGYEMTLFDQPAAPTSGCAGTGHTEFGVTSTLSPIDGQVDFVGQDGTTPLCMSVSNNPDWWQWDHGNVFTTTVNWVELIMPANTRAFSLYVGAVSGRGWIEGENANGDTTMMRFGGDSGVDFGWNNTPGFGVYSADSCSSISRIVIEPWEWGTGHFAINQDPCTSSVSVPEPSPIALLALGLLGIAFARHGQMTKRHTA